MRSSGTETTVHRSCSPIHRLRTERRGSSTTSPITSQRSGRRCSGSSRPSLPGMCPTPSRSNTSSRACNIAFIPRFKRTTWSSPRDSKFGTDVISAVRDLGSQPTRTAFRSPWQNGVAERWVGSCRRDLLDHVIVLNEQHLKRLMSEYVRYYHEDRTHLGLGKDTPTGRSTVTCPAVGSKIHSFPRLGGLHHRYAVAA